MLAEVIRVLCKDYFRKKRVETGWQNASKFV